MYLGELSMTQALIKLDENINRVLNIVKAKYDLKDKSEAELTEMLKEKKLELFTLNAKQKTMQLTNTSELRVAKKDIARIQTALTAARSK